MATRCCVSIQRDDGFWAVGGMDADGYPEFVREMVGELNERGLKTLFCLRGRSLEPAVLDWEDWEYQRSSAGVWRFRKKGATEWEAL